MNELEIVEEVRKEGREYLYKLSHPSYRNTCLKQNTWRDIGLIVSATPTEAMKRRRALRSRYVKLNKQLKSGSAAIAKNSRDESLIRELDFLKDDIIAELKPNELCFGNFAIMAANDDIYSPEKIKLVRQLFLECRALNIRDKNYSQINLTDTSEHVFCPLTFDGYLCWPTTRAGSIATQNCPGFVTGFDKTRIAHKSCLQNGTWFAHPETGREWSNYTNCVDTVDYDFRRMINGIYIGGYSVSLVTLIISLFIFFSFRSLKCTRIRIHIQLFVSLALSCIAWIVWYKFFVESSESLSESQTPCIIFHLTLHFLMLTNYFWMFCEGLHLILVLVVVFVKDTIAMRWFLLIGWISPILWISIYGIVRGNYTADTKHCWSEESHTMWILIAPVILSLFASKIFLAKVVRVLLTKLHPCSAQPAPLAIRKAARATLILVPLFGLQHLLLPFRPDKGTQFEKYYQFVSAVLISLQGFCVSCLFCFANHDVVFAVRNFLGRTFPNIYTGAGGGESVNAVAATQSRDIIV